MGLPSPSELFLVSVGACFGITVKSFVNAWRMKDDYLSDYVDDFKIEVSEETNMKVKVNNREHYDSCNIKASQRKY